MLDVLFSQREFATWVVGQCPDILLDALAVIQYSGQGCCLNILECTGQPELSVMPVVEFPLQNAVKGSSKRVENSGSAFLPLDSRLNSLEWS